MYNKHNNMLLATLLKALTEDFMLEQFCTADDFKVTVEANGIKFETFRGWCRGQHFPNPSNIKRIAGLFAIKEEFLTEVHEQKDLFRKELEGIHRYNVASGKRLNSKLNELTRDLAHYYSNQYGKELFYKNDVVYQLDARHIK